MIKLPLEVYISSKKKWVLNLNNYRNAHYIVLSKSKTLYADLIRHKIPLEANFGRVRLVYTYYHGSKRRVDISNPCSIIDKYFCDVATSVGLWKDDNSDVVQEVVYKWGGVDKDDPRCEVEIIEL